MGLGEGGFKILEKLFKNNFFNEIHSIMELGSQQVSVNNRIVSSFLESISKEKFSNSLEDSSTKPIYKLLGVTEYECIDSDGEFGAHVFDLNKEINKEYNYKKQFDLVTNFGTSEHIFNQFACFRNIHNLTKVGGYMFHAVPFVGYVSDCFYQYTKPFFTTLAKDNNYDIKDLWIGYTDVVPYSEENIKKCSNHKIMIFCLLKKTSDEPFKVPFQEKYKEISKLK